MNDKCDIIDALRYLITDLNNNEDNKNLLIDLRRISKAFGSEVKFSLKDIHELRDLI